MRFETWIFVSMFGIFLVIKSTNKSSGITSQSAAGSGLLKCRPSLVNKIFHVTPPPRQRKNTVNEIEVKSRSCDVEVRFVINSFDSKNCNLHDFPFKLLKAISPYVSSHIASLFNLMIVEGHYPDI